MKYVKYTDPFLGNGEITLPEQTFPASSWHFIKGLSGNTSPAAALPFGKYTACGYDGAYPCGSGINDMNCGGPIRKLFDRPHFIGISHLHHDGTGAIGVYYNYALTCPYDGDFPSFQPFPILREEAEPGYYLAETDSVTAEATVTRSAALHRYRFKGSGVHRVAVDFANDGLHSDEWGMRGKVTGKVEVLSETRLRAVMTIQKAEIVFDFEVRGASLVSLYRGTDTVPGNEVSLDLPSSDTRMGGIFALTGNEAEVRLVISFAGIPDRSPFEAEPRSFDEARKDAEAEWEEALSKIEIDTEDEREKEIFYSNLYHTLTKPCDYTGEAFFFHDKGRKMVTDLATMWDIYKTQFPLLYTLYPDISEKILSTFAAFGEEYGYYPHCLLASGRLDIENRQARSLAEYTVCDAYYRGIGADYPALVEGAEKDARRTPAFFGPRPLKTTPGFYASHILDMAEAFSCLAPIANELGMTETAERYAEYGKRFSDAFGPDGMMRPDSDYYEGNRYNYSFRPLFDREARIAIAGRENLIREAERFFGFLDPADLSSRFEGFNNETDMEAPLFLHELGLRDRMCEVIVSGMDSTFTTGRGGVPGNADSGGLNACYLWNVIGIFPVSGQNRMIVGSPRFPETVLHLKNADFRIVKTGEGIYPEKAEWNGTLLPDFELPVTEMMKGGTLTVTMKEKRKSL